MSEQKWVAVDFDGVLAEYDGWNGIEDIGDPVDGAKEFMERLREMGLKVVIFTTRTNPNPFYEDTARHAPGEAEHAIGEWLERHGMPYDRIFTGRGKPIASAYVDDRAVTCTPDTAADSAKEFKAAIAHVQSLT